MPENDYFYEQDLRRQHEIDEYWTVERMQKATPAVLPALPAEEYSRLIQSPAPRPAAQVLPSREARQLGDAYPVDPDQRPYRDAGKLFFTEDDGTDHACSASFVGSNRVVLTAGHCVRNAGNGAWYSNFLFYRGGTGHWWGWSGQKVSLDRVGCYPMFLGPNYRYDYAFGHTTSDSEHGALGLATGVPYASFTSLGYPGNYGNGQSMYAADGSKGPIAGGVVRMAPNPMTKGCSGGPWVGALSHEFGPHSNIVCGLNSHMYDNDPGAMYGPYFDVETVDLYDYIRTGTSPGHHR